MTEKPIPSRGQNEIYPAHFQNKGNSVALKSKKQYADATNGSTKDCFASAKVLAASALHFVDRDKATVEWVIRKWQEKISLFYE
ncbi:hypothetical protein [uncultured Pontibacter sp.]|uniref:hypothetical protein n=1 Tax=uncultured Pontibacter sp. TaxID=453356 RepID=UPI00260BC54A|nr:hypothetical protein [uncultured Pontibacter sp.]